MLKKYDNVRKTIKMSVYLIVEGGGASFSTTNWGASIILTAENQNFPSYRIFCAMSL